LDVRRDIEYLSRFPIIGKFLGECIEKEFASGRKEHPLFHCLSKGEPDWKKIESVKTRKDDMTTFVIVPELRVHHDILVNLDRNMKTLCNKPNFGTILEHLRKSSSFWQGYSEVEAAALFERFFGRIDLEPHLKNRNSVDFAFPMNDKKVYVEVNTPKMGQKFKDALMENAVGIDKQPKAYTPPDSTDRTKDVILAEFEHFKGAEVPSLVLYDFSQCELRGTDLVDRFLGTFYAVIYTDKQTGKSHFESKRKPDSVIINDPDLEYLGGIICYGRDFNIEGQVVYDPLDLIGIAFPIEVMEKIAKPFIKIHGSN